MARQRDLFANFERMRREMDELFGDVWGAGGWRRAAGSPASRRASTSTTATASPPRAVVKVDLAGVDLATVELEISGPRAGDQRRAPGAGDRGPRLPAARDRPGPFRRVVELSADVDAERAKATYEDGDPADRAAARAQRPRRTPRSRSSTG